MKAGFMVQENFMEANFGIRNYFSTINKVMKDMGIRTEYLIHREFPRTTMWYMCNLEGLSKKMEGRGDNKIEMYRGKGKITFSKYEKWQEENIRVLKPAKYFRCIGNDIGKQEYDIFFITNPWLINSNISIHAKRTVAIVYDFIPSLYVLTTQKDLFEWGNMHHRCNKYFNEYCDEILCITEEVLRQYKKFFPNVDLEKVQYLSPFVPYELRNAEYVDEKKENSIICAAPFDVRKGLKEIPEFVNSLKKELDTLYIYGLPMCPREDFDYFFEKLEVRHVVYYPKVSPAELVSLYKKSKFLLFPSWDEGLGIPIIESQVCGCRPIVRNISPMSDLSLDEKKILVNGDLMDCVETIGKELIGDTYPYRKLSQLARKTFSYDEIKDFVNGTGRFSKTN